MAEFADKSRESDALFMATLEQGQTVAGKYVIGRTIGIGGMGVVFAARDESLDRPVAIKALQSRFLSSRTATQRFLREARAATRITSEHAVKLLEVDALPDGTPLLVMEYLTGMDLREVLRDRGPLPVKLAVDYTLQALQAVAEAHQKGIVHRDLKPSNLFLTARADGTPLLKVLDFGIAKTLEEQAPEALSLTGSEDVRLGSPVYMPPEQLQNPSQVDARADIWALGVTLYELVCGRPPFRGRNYAELISNILSITDDSVNARMVEVGIPTGLANILRRCLRKKRDERFASVAELATALAPLGSADARLSLSRVLGLARAPVTPRAPEPLPLMFARDALDSCETTASLPIDAPLDRDHSTTAPSARPTSARSPQRIGAAFLVFACAVGVFFSLFEHRQALLAAPAATAREISPAVATSKVVSSAVISALVPTASVARTILSDSIAPAPSSKPAPLKLKHGAPVSARVAPVTTSTPSVSEVPSGAPASANTSSSDDAHSPLIETLIEQRH